MVVASGFLFNISNNFGVLCVWTHARLCVRSARIDQGSGCIIEFPLIAVSKV